MDASKWFRNSFLWLLVMVFVLAIAFQVFRNGNSNTKNIPLSGSSQSLVSRITQQLNPRNANPKHLTLNQDGDTVTLQYDGGTTKYQTNIGDRLDVTEILADVGVNTKGPR